MSLAKAPSKPRRTPVAAKTELPRGLYSISTAAAYLSVSVPTINRWLARGYLTGFHVGRLRRFTKAELDRFIQYLEAESEAS